MRRGGVEVPLVTSDGPFPESLNGGKLPGALPTGNFGSRTEERFGTLRQYTEGGPLMCTEFWVGSTTGATGATCGATWRRA